MNSNMELASRMLNDYITSGEPVALAAVFDLVEEFSPCRAEALRALAVGAGEGEDLYWSDAVREVVGETLLTFATSRREWEKAIASVYHAGISFVD